MLAFYFKFDVIEACGLSVSCLGSKIESRLKRD